MSGLSLFINQTDIKCTFNEPNSSNLFVISPNLKLVSALSLSLSLPLCVYLVSQSSGKARKSPSFLVLFRTCPNDLHKLAIQI